MILINFSRRFITLDEIQLLEEGDCWHMDTDGQSYPFTIKAITGDAYYLESLLSKGPPIARLEKHEVPGKLYQPMPESRTLH
jgi:hypothetical protein